MSWFRLHVASWVGLVAVCLLLLHVSHVLPPVDYWPRYGYPWLFWDDDHLNVGHLAFDFFVGIFLLAGTVAAIEIWCRNYGAPKVSLLAMFGATAAFASHLTWHIGWSPSNELEISLRMALWMAAQDYCHVLITMTFGIAVVGWGKLIGLAIKRRKASRH